MVGLVSGGKDSCYNLVQVLKYCVFHHFVIVFVCSVCRCGARFGLPGQPEARHGGAGAGQPDVPDCRMGSGQYHVI